MGNIRDQLKKAKCKKTSEEELKELLDCERENVRQAVISNINFTENMQIAIANDINTSEDILRLLADSNYDIVRNCVAIHKKCSTEVIEKFFEQKDALMGVASNPNTSIVIIEELVNYDRGIYKEFISCNPSAPIHILELLSTNIDEDIRLNIVLNPSTPKNILNGYVTDKSSSVRLALTKHTNISKNILTILSKDENLDVSKQAKDSLKNRKTDREKNDELNKIIKKKISSRDDEFDLI